ncbi:secreted protein, partial [Candidatus Thiomargarita nelsonii]
MNNQLLTFLTCGFSLLFSTLTAASSPAGLTTQDWMMLQEKIHTSVYQFNKADGIYTAYNAKQQLQARITQKAVQVRSR